MTPKEIAEAAEGMGIAEYQRVIWNAALKRAQREFRAVGRIQTALALEKLLLLPGEKVKISDKEWEEAAK